jgi:CubicO group peptidase (beta-lactamase class C family)
LFIKFHHGNEDYKIQLVEGKKSDVSVVIHGVTYSVMAEHEQLEVVKNIFASIALDSLSSIEELSERIGSLKGISFAKSHAVGIDSIHPAPLDATAREKQLAIETGIMRLIPMPGMAVQPISIEQRMRELRIPGSSIAVIDQEELWTSGYGELELTKPVLIQAASISKTITALAILSLIDQCREARKNKQPSGLFENIFIDLDTDVSTLLEPDLWRSIDPDGTLDKQNPKMTIRQLLSHTAGIPVSRFDGYLRIDEVDKEIFLLKDRIDHLSHHKQEGDIYPESVDALNERLKKLESERLTFLDQKIPSLDGILRGEGNSSPVRVVETPGLKFEYSGGGTTVLQKVIEVVTGQSFETVVQERVLDPLKMNNSTYHPEQFSTSHGHEGTGSVIPGQWRIHPELAAAGLWSTSLDLAKMARGIQRSIMGKKGAILSSELTNEMLTPQTKEQTNGLGVLVAQTPKSTYFFHNGATFGFRCEFVANSEGQGAVVMTNSQLGNYLISEIIPTIAKVYHWPNADALPTTPPRKLTDEEMEFISLQKPINREKWNEVVGSYRFEEHFVKISLLDGKAFVEVDQNLRFELTPLTENIGFYQVPEIGPGIVRFQRAGDVITSINLFDFDHNKI